MDNRGRRVAPGACGNGGRRCAARSWWTAQSGDHSGNASSHAQLRASSTRCPVDIPSVARINKHQPRFISRAVHSRTLHHPSIAISPQLFCYLRGPPVVCSPPGTRPAFNSGAVQALVRWRMKKRKKNTEKKTRSRCLGARAQRQRVSATSATLSAGRNSTRASTSVES